MIVATPALEIRTTTTPDLDDGLCAGWCQLAAPSFMSSPEWLLTAWDEFHRHQGRTSLWCQVAGQGHARIAGLAPWYREQKHGLRWLRLLGDGTICSDYAQLPAEPSSAPTVYRALAEAIADGGENGRAPNADVIEIDGHVEADPAWAVFFDTLAEHGWRAQTRPTEGTWVVELPSTWDEFEAQLHKSRRRKARKAFKLLRSGQLTHRVVETAEGLAAEWPEFVRLHQLRREQLGQPGCFAHPRFGDFLLAATTRLMELGTAWLSVVSSGGQPLAMLLMFDSGQRSSMYQSGIDVTRMAMEPGHMVNTLTIAHAIGRGMKYFDLLRGDEPYKRGWNATRTGLARTRLFAPTLRGRAVGQLAQLHAAWKAVRSQFAAQPALAREETDAED
jgi:CelD/BcsL family acetyltransferase involved in cellulose biosynthesis